MIKTENSQFVGGQLSCPRAGSHHIHSQSVSVSGRECTLVGWARRSAILIFCEARPQQRTRHSQFVGGGGFALF